MALSDMIINMPGKKKQIYAFIDSQNLNLGIQKAGFKMDWRKFRQYLEKDQGVTEAFMFIGYVPEFEPMYQQLHDSGYKIVLKPTFDMTKPHPEMMLEHTDKPTAEQSPAKGNIDADLVLWAMKEFPHYSKAVIVSGDGDFFCLVEYLEAQKKLGKILTPNDHYSGLYNRYDSYVVRLDTLKRRLAYSDRRSGSKNKGKK